MHLTVVEILQYLTFVLEGTRRKHEPSVGYYHVNYLYTKL